MSETSTIFGFMKYVSATDILSDFKKTVDSHFVNSLKGCKSIMIYILFSQLFYTFWKISQVFYIHLNNPQNSYRYLTVLLQEKIYTSNTKERRKWNEKSGRGMQKTDCMS